MGTLRLVTFTGVDERTDFNEVLEMVKNAGAASRFIEWGVLYSPSKAGTGGRYPSLEWIEQFALRANKAGLRIALHLCGSAVKDLLAFVQSKESTVHVRQILSLAEQFGRVQLNTRGSARDVQLFKQLIAEFTRYGKRTQVLLQWNEHNQELCQLLSFEHGFEALVDGSGGRGLAPGHWPTASDIKVRRIGYAGGLGPHNILEQLPQIYAASQDSTFWIDMEQSLRNESDDFDLSRCVTVLNQVLTVENTEQQKCGNIYGKGTIRVNKLKGLWLDWWVGKSQQLPMIIPPKNAVKAMYLYRATGSYESYEPGESGSTAIQLMRNERISLIPVGKSRWKAGYLDSNVEATGSVMELAILRAVVAKYFGSTVPRNPADLGPKP